MEGMTLPQKIREYTNHLLISNKRSVNDFAKAIQMSQSTLSVFLNDEEGKRDVSSVTLEKIAKGFGMDAGKFLIEASEYLEKKTLLNVFQKGSTLQS